MIGYGQERIVGNGRRRRLLGMGGPRHGQISDTFGEVDWSKIAFGCELSSDETIDVTAGDIIYPTGVQAVGGATVYISVGATSAAPEYVYLEFQMSDLTTASVPTSALASKPTPDGNTYRVWLCEAYYTSSGQIVIGTRGHFGNVLLGAIPVD